MNIPLLYVKEHGEFFNIPENLHDSHDQTSLYKPLVFILLG